MERKKKIFILFLLTNLCLNYDSGVIPASLLQIVKEINLGYKEQALLGSLVYLGLSATSLFASPIIAKYGAKLVITVSVLINSISCFIFSMTSSKLLLFFTRFMMGMSQAFLVIYGPVWVNNYSPKNKSSTWMGLMHSCTIFGLVIGYIIAGLIINLLHPYINWRFSIQIQAIAEIPLAVLIFLEKNEFINIQLSTKNRNEIFEMQDIYYQLKKGKFTFQDEMKVKKNISNKDNNENVNSVDADQGGKEIIQINNNNIISNINNKANEIINNKKEEGLIEGNPLSSPLSLANVPNTPNSQRLPNTNNNNSLQLHYILEDGEHPLANSNIVEQSKLILQNKLYLFVTLALCSIYFIVTSIQFWMTSYFIEVIGANPVVVVFIFSLVTVTAPLSGILIGGCLSDSYGGYKGDNIAKAMQMALAFCFIAFIFSFPIGFIFSFSYVTILIWAFLFFGAAIVPIATGIMISCVPRECQATSSSLSQLIFNMGGYFLSPFLTGFVMDFFRNKIEGFIWGVRVGFWWVFFSVSFLYLGFNEANKIIKNKNKNKGVDNDNVQGVNAALNSCQSVSETDSLGRELVKFIQIEIKRRIAVSTRI